MTSAGPAAQAALIPRRITPLTALRNVLTLAWRGLVQIKHNPMELVDLSIQPISGSVEAYLPILIPGIIVQNALFASMSTGFGLNVDVTKGVFDRFRSLPIARTAPLLGRILSDVVKQAWSMLVVLVVGMAIGFRVETGVVGVLGSFLLLLAFTLMFAWVTVLVGLTVSEPEKVQVFGFTAIFPLTFLSTAFVVPRESTPAWLKTFMADVNPASQLIAALRGLLLGGPVLQHALIALAWGAVIAAIFIPLCLRAFRRRV